MTWSYPLPPDREQRLFRHLGVFPDGFNLATAESLGADLDVRTDATQGLSHLVDASMVELSFGTGSRYRMLDVVRSYARDQLDAEGEADAAAEHFLRWALALVAWINRATATDQEPLADLVLRASSPTFAAHGDPCRTTAASTTPYET